MRRAKVSIALAVCLSVTAAGAVAAAPDKGCSNGDFTSIELNLTWQPGEPIPGPGEDAWWDLTLAGFATEGETPGSIAFRSGSVAYSGRASRIESFGPYAARAWRVASRRSRSGSSRSRPGSGAR